MLALSCNEVVMGKQSSLGPIDPEVMGFSAYAVLEEFERARKETAAGAKGAVLWERIIEQYPPTLVGECRRTAQWASDTTRDWLKTGMFKGEPNAGRIAARIAKALSNREATKSHSRHVSPERAASLGIRVRMLEEDQNLQDAVLTVHHAYLYTFANNERGLYKIVENDRGVGVMQSAEPASFVDPAAGPPAP
jgi:hypothetical protein